MSEQNGTESNETTVVYVNSAAEACRRLLAENPSITAEQAVSLARERFGREVSRATFAVTKHQMNRGNGNVASSRGGRSGPDGPSVDDLIKLREAIEEAGLEMSDVQEAIDRVDTMASIVGGMGNLKKCVEALAKLSG